MENKCYLESVSQKKRINVKGRVTEIQLRNNRIYRSGSNGGGKRLMDLNTYRKWNLPDLDFDWLYKPKEQRD